MSARGECLTPLGGNQIGMRSGTLCQPTTANSQCGERCNRPLRGKRMRMNFGILGIPPLVPPQDVGGDQEGNTPQSVGRDDIIGA